LGFNPTRAGQLSKVRSWNEFQPTKDADRFRRNAVLLIDKCRLDFNPTRAGQLSKVRSWNEFQPTKDADRFRRNAVLLIDKCRLGFNPTKAEQLSKAEIGMNSNLQKMQIGFEEMQFCL